MSLNSLDFWRLADELSVIDAAILITGHDPSGQFDVFDENGFAIKESNGSWRTAQRRDYEGYDATFKALKSSIGLNKLRANVRHRVIKAEYEQIPEGGYQPLDPGPEYKHIPYDFLIAQHGPEKVAGTVSNFSIDEYFLGCDDFYLCKEPDWESSTIAVEDLKEWLSIRGIFPAFFFPRGKEEGFRNKDNPRYAPKLAACIAAWETVQAPEINRTVKQTLKDWIRSNAAAYGVGDDSGIVSDPAAEALAIIVNWAPEGGAPPTATKGKVALTAVSPIQN